MATTFPLTAPVSSTLRKNPWWRPTKFELGVLVGIPLLTVCSAYGGAMLAMNGPRQMTTTAPAIERIVKPSIASTIASASYTTKRTPATTTAAAASRTVAKRPYLDPAIVRGTIDGKVFAERIYANSGPKSYVLKPQDHLDVILPAAARADEQVTFHGTRLGRVDYGALLREPSRTLTMDGSIRLLDKAASKTLSSYRIDVRFRPVVAAAQPAVAAPPVRDAPLTIQTSTREYRATSAPRTILGNGYTISY